MQLLEGINLIRVKPDDSDYTAVTLVLQRVSLCVPPRSCSIEY